MRSNSNQAQQRSLSNRRKESVVSSTSNLKRKSSRSTREEQTTSHDSQEKSEEPPKKKRGRPRLKSNEDSETSKLRNEGRNSETKSENKSLLTSKNETKDDQTEKKDLMIEKNVSERTLREDEKTSKKETDSEEVTNETDPELVSGNKKKDLIKNRKETKRNLRITSGRRSRDAIARHSLLMEQSLAKADNEKSHPQNNDSAGCDKSSNVEEMRNLKENETKPNDTIKTSNTATGIELKKIPESDVLLEDTKEKPYIVSLEEKDLQQEKLKKIGEKELQEINKASSSNTSFSCGNEENETIIKEDIKKIGSHETDPVCNKNENSENLDVKPGDTEDVEGKQNISVKDEIFKEGVDSSEISNSSKNESNNTTNNKVESGAISKSELKSNPETNELEDKNLKVDSKLDPVLNEAHCFNEDSSSLKNEGKNLPLDSSVCSPSSSGNETINRTSSRLMKPRQRGPYRPGIDFKVGSRLEACDFMEKWYPSKIVGVDWKEHEVLIHFERWSSRFDEWVSMDSPRLRAITRTSARKEYRQKLQQVTFINLQKLEFKVGDNVLAKWVDGKMYPAKVVIINNNGTCEVMFHDDGIQKLVKLAHIQKISKDDPLYQTPLPKTANLPSSEKRSRSLETRSRSESREKKANKTAPRKDSPSAVEESTSNKTKGRSTEKSDKNSRTKQVLKSLKNEKSSSYGFMMKRKKLLVGGIFQAKRTHTDVPASKKSIFMKRRQQKDVQEESETIKKNVQSKKTMETPEENEKPLPVDNADTPSKDLVSQPSVSSEESTSTEESVKKRKPSGGTAPKEFIIEEDHNHFKCPIQECGKGFRKESLLASHMKHYHNKQNKKEPIHVKRKSESDKSAPKQQIENKVDEEVSKTEEVIEKDIKIKESDPEIVVPPVPSSDEKPIIKDTESTPVRRGERQRKYSSITKELGGRRRKYLLNKNTTKETKPAIMPSQTKTNDQTSNVKRKGISKDKNVSGTNTKDIKGNFGYDCTVKDGSRKRKLITDSDKNNRTDENIKVEPPSQQETVQDDAAAIIEAVVKYEAESNVVEGGTSKLSHKVRKTGRKRHAGIGSKMIKEEATSAPGDKPNNELSEATYFYDDDNDEEDARNEVVNCICRFKEEEGLMMQCENCMAWQHGSCFNIEEEEKVPEKYICFACRNPKAQRRGYKYWYEQGWWKTGEMATFNFLPKEEPNPSFQNSVLKSHALISSIQAVSSVLHSLRHKLLIAENPDHPDLKHWKQPWTDLSLSCETKPLSLYDQPNDNIQIQKGELTYTDHSYSAVNRNNSHSTLLMNSRMPVVDIVNNEMESFTMDMEDSKSEEPSHDVLIQRNVNDGDISLPSHEKENNFVYESSVNLNLQEIKPDPESLMIVDDNKPSNKITSESTLEENDTKSFLEITNEHSSIAFTDSKANILNDCSPKSSVDDPILCQLNVLDHIEQMQEEIDRRLEEITHHVEALESDWEVIHPHQKTLTGTLSVKKMLKLLQNNLSKVQKMSLFS